MDDPLTEERQCPYLLNLWNMGGVKSPAIGHMTKTSDTNIQCKPRLIQDKELTNNRQVIHITLSWVS